MSGGWQVVWGIIGAGIGIAVLVTAVKNGRPVRSILASGIQGLCAMAAVNVAGIFTGVSIGLNAFTGSCCLMLGIPGVITLLIERVILGV